MYSLNLKTDRVLDFTEEKKQRKKKHANPIHPIATAGEFTQGKSSASTSRAPLASGQDKIGHLLQGFGK